MNEDIQQILLAAVAAASEAACRPKVRLLDDVMSRDDANVPEYRTTAALTEAVLIVHEGQTKPGLMLADGMVVPLTFAQAFALRNVFKSWLRSFAPVDDHQWAANMAALDAAEGWTHQPAEPTVWL